MLLIDHDPVAAAVVEGGDGGGAAVDRFAGEFNAGFLQARVLGLDVVHEKCSERNAFGVERGLEGFGGRVFAVGLKQQLGTFGFLGGYDGHKARIAHRNVLVFHKAQFVRVKRERSIEVGHEYTFEFDLHERASIERDVLSMVKGFGLA